MTKTKNSNLTSYLALFWLAFWLLNGLDKFLYQTDIGFLTWYGKDRGWQFLTYITNMQLSADFVAPILWFAGIWEVAVSLFFAVFLWSRISNQSHNKGQSLNIYNIALKISLLTFTGFCGFDIVVGDRAELLEHSIYVGIVGISYLISYVERVFSAEG